MNLDWIQSALSEISRNPAEFFLNGIYRIGLLNLLGYLFLFLLVIGAVRLILRSLGTKELGGAGRKDVNPREARRAFKQKDFLRAGELYESMGDLETAARCYKEVRAYWNLGNLAEQQRKWDDAARYYQMASDFDKALPLYQKAGNFVKAAELCLSTKRLAMAAEFFEKGKQYKEAALQYERLGNLSKAALMYERTNDVLKAAELYERFFLQERGGSGQSDGGGQIALQSGKLYQKSGNPRRAAEIFLAGGFAGEAAEAYLCCGEKEKAAEAFSRAKNFARAAHLYQDLGETQKGKRLLAEQFREERKFHQAAQTFEEAGEYLEAAEMYERVDNQKKAGEMFFAAADYGHASEIFLHLGDHGAAAQALEKGRRFQEAANLYLKIGDLGRAGQLLEAAGDFYQAGLIYRKMGNLEESIALLQKVETTSEEYLKVSLVLGQIFVERGMVEAAKERYQRIISSKMIGPQNIEVYYQLAQIHEKGKDFDEALSLYEKILAQDIQYKDVKAKSDLLKKALTTVKKALKSEEKEKATDNGLSGSPDGRYRIIKKLGQGGMGVVYQAEDSVLKRIVAYKVLPPSLKEHPAVLNSFLQEARVAAALNHPNIVTIYDTGKNARDIFITMEFVDGISLKESLEKNSNQPLSKLLEIMREICKGVAYAHSRKVIHRDIKPANVMIGKDGAVKIMDFGLAKVLSQSMADKTSVKGTPLYMSPEQILGQNVDHQSDVYSLGCSFYRMVTGRPPFIQGDVYYHHLHTQPTPPKQLNTRLPDSMNRIILRAIEKTKEKRYKSAEELLADLDRTG